jgi:hypothetical protein
MHPVDRCLCKRYWCPRLMGTTLDWQGSHRICAGSGAAAGGPERPSPVASHDLTCRLVPGTRKRVVANGTPERGFHRLKLGCCSASNCSTEGTARRYAKDIAAAPATYRHESSRPLNAARPTLTAGPRRTGLRRRLLVDCRGRRQDRPADLRRGTPRRRGRQRRLPGTPSGVVDAHARGAGAGHHSAQPDQAGPGSPLTPLSPVTGGVRPANRPPPGHRCPYEEGANAS